MIYDTLLFVICGEDNILLLFVSVAVDFLVLFVAITDPCSGLLTFTLFIAFVFDEVDVILQTDTAFLRYFLSRLDVPLVIPTS
jgi:hypothetical protein